MKFPSFSPKIFTRGVLPLRKWLKMIRGNKAFIICPQCNAVYYEKSWKHLNKELNDVIKNSDSNQKKVTYKLCPADQMIKKGGFEGEIIIKNPPQDQNRKQELLNLVKNISQKTYERDPLDKLISIEDSGNRIRILLTDNNLALSMGKQIIHAFKGNFKVSFSRLRKLAHVEINLE